MADLIDRDVAYSVLEKYYHIRTEIQRMDLREALSRVPDGVVRCKDCSLYRENYTENGDYWSIHYEQYCQNWDRETFPDGFCMDGERRDDGRPD